jgi:hypothetical protein
MTVPDDNDFVNDPLFCAGVIHIGEVINRAQAGSWEDKV